MEKKRRVIKPWLPNQSREAGVTTAERLKVAQKRFAGSESGGGGPF